MGVLFAFLVTRQHPSSNAKQREARCHLLAVDFPRHSRYTERCWMQLSAGPRSGGRLGARRKTPDSPDNAHPFRIA